MRLKLQHGAASRVIDVSDDATLGAIADAAVAAFDEIPATAALALLSGFPRAPVRGAREARAADAGVRGGSVVEVRIGGEGALPPAPWACGSCTLINEGAAASCAACDGARPAPQSAGVRAAPAPAAAAAVSSAAAPRSAVTAAPSASSSAAARPAATAGGRSGAAAAPAAAAAAGIPAAPAPPGALVRHEVPADNSCLFASLN
jgi:ubiquitin thioesterase OTU1